MHRFLKLLLAFAIPYSIVMSVLYLGGFWGTLGINIFEWLAPQDVLAHSVLPLTGTALLVLLCAAIGWSFLLTHPPSPQHSRSRWATIKRTIGRVFMACSAILYPVIAFVFITRRNWIVGVSFFAFAVGLWVFIDKADLLRGEIPNRNARSFILFALVILPFAAVATGHERAQRLMKEELYQYIESTELPGEAASMSPTRLKFLGKAGDHFLFLQSDNHTVVVVRADAFPTLVLKTFRVTPPKPPS